MVGKIHLGVIAPYHKKGTQAGTASLKADLELQGNEWDTACL